MREIFANQPDWSKEPLPRPDPLHNILMERPWMELLGETVTTTAYAAFLGAGAVTFTLIALALWPVIHRRRKIHHD